MARDETIKLSLIDGVTRTLGQIREGVSGVGSDLVKLNQGAELAAKGFGLIGSAVQSIAGAVKTAADLEAALAVIRERTGATAEEMRALDVAMQAALAGGLADGQAIVNTMTMLAREGLSATQVAQQLGPVLAFAAANATDATAAVGSLQDVLGGFNRPADEIAALADKLTALGKATGTPVEVLQKGLAGVAVQADAAGLSLDNTLLLIAGLSTRAIEGGRASAQLGKAIAELADPATKAGEALKEVGGNSADLMKSLELLSRDGRAAERVLSELGAKPRAALQALLADGGAALDGLRAKMNEASGASQEASDQIGLTLNRAVTQLQNAIVGLRNEFLTPMLEPLASEAAQVAEKLDALGDSPQFAKIRDQFTATATEAIRAVGQFIADADVQEWSEKTQIFADQAMQAFDALVVVVKATAATIRGIGAAIDYVAERGAAFDAALGLSRESAKKFGAAAADLDKPLSHLNRGLSDSKKAAAGQAQAMSDASGAARAFVSPADDAADAAQKIADGLGEVPKAAKLTEVTLEKLAGGAEQAAIGLERLRLATLTSAIAALARENLQGTDTFRALVAEVAKTEASIAKMQEAIDKAKGAQKDLSDQTDSAANSLRNFASAASDAGGAAADLKSSNSQVADSFGNIGNKSSETAISLGNLSEAFVRQALDAAGAAKSAKDYIDTLNRFFAAGADQEEKIKARLEVLNRHNAALSEEERIRRRIILQYGESSALTEELIRREIELARAKKLTNDETERGIQIEAQRTAGFGGVGTGQQAEATGGATGGRGSGGGGDRGAPQIVINVQGMTTDQARQFVEQSVVPELERINRLSR